MYKLVGIWSAPRAEDIDAFEKHYGEVHAVLASKVPHLRRIVCTLTSDGFAGGDPSFYRLAEMFFDSPQDLEASSKSDEWHAMHADAGHVIERFGVTLEAAQGWERDVTGGS